MYDAFTDFPIDLLQDDVACYFACQPDSQIMFIEQS